MTETAVRVGRLQEQEARVANLKEKAAVVEPPPISLGGSGGDGVNER